MKVSFSVFRRVALSVFLVAPAILAQEDLEHFEKKIRPVLLKSCVACHNAKVKTSGLDLSSPEAMMQGGHTGALVSKDAPDNSLLLKVLSYEGQLKMPPSGKLPAETLADFEAWVKAGAKVPGVEHAAAVRPAAAAKKREFTEEEKKFWSLQKLVDTAPPKVKASNWVKSPIDAFVLAKLEQKGVKPAAPASKETLLRRVTFDLTGLPPTEQEIREFLADKSPQAFQKVVDRLLASPRYGEKWGRHWLDIARYADSTGNDEDHRYPYAWRYRDYVIDSFNRDVPYDQFVREQIAGDLLPAPDGSALNKRGIVATGFLALGPKAIAQQDKTKMLYDIYDEQVDVTTKAIMGVTLACARCHDHKFDPLLTKDYYSMVSIFASTKNFKKPESHVSEMLHTPLAPEAEYKAYLAGKEKVTAKESEISQFAESALEPYVDAQARKLAEYMLAAHQVNSGKATAAEAGQAAGLDIAMLERWVKYLKPDPEKPRAHLADWEQSSDSDRKTVAEAYQARYLARLPELRAAMEKSKGAKRRRPGPPEGFDAKADPFFSEVTFRGPFRIPESEHEKLLPDEAKARIAELKRELEQVKASVPPEPEMADAVMEGEVVNQKVFVRGDYNSPGEEAPKAFPVIVNGPPRPAEVKGSGRLDLANWMTNPDHPLTPRVIVNRVWYWHFGEGIVRTPDNFGKMGERPTHPELLDYLAKRFMEDGWSLKKLHRRILLSNTYQMGSTPSRETVTADPENKLFSRFPRRRLQVEDIRDGLLSIDGSLDTTMGGTLQKGFGTDLENSNDRLSLKPEVVKRRMVYVPLRRANLPTLLNLFDFGDATTSLGKRPSTTIAPQALFMMNSEFVAERARNLAKQLAEGASSDTERANRLYLRVLNRPASAEELDTAVTYVTALQKKFPGKVDDKAAWASLSRILIASNEFIYVE